MKGDKGDKGETGAQGPAGAGGDSGILNTLFDFEGQGLPLNPSSLFLRWERYPFSSGTGDYLQGFASIVIQNSAGQSRVQENLAADIPETVLRTTDFDSIVKNKYGSYQRYGIYRNSTINQHITSFYIDNVANLEDNVGDSFILKCEDSFIGVAPSVLTSLPHTFVLRTYVRPGVVENRRGTGVQTAATSTTHPGNIQIQFDNQTSFTGLAANPFVEVKTTLHIDTILPTEVSLLYTISEIDYTPFTNSFGDAYAGRIVFTIREIPAFFGVLLDRELRV